MNDRLKLTLTGMWLIAALSAVVLPVVLPSLSGDNLAGNPIGFALVSMFFLSLPSSLVALPLASFLNAAFGMATTPIASMYLYVWTLFMLGAVQWFWLVPRVFRNKRVVETIELNDRIVNAGLPEANVAEFDMDGITRLERVLENNELPRANQSAP